MKLLLTILSFCIATELQAQRMEFNISGAGKDIGNFFIERYISEDSTYFYSESLVTFDVIFSEYTVKYISQAFYLRDTLNHCNVTVLVNGKFKKSTDTQRKDGGYNVIFTDDKKKESLHTFKHQGYLTSSSSLFYDIPSQGDTSYAELYGNGGVIDYTSTGQYNVENLDGYNPTHYFISNGQVQKRVVENLVLDFVMTLTSVKELPSNTDSSNSKPIPKTF
ncbi:hypothetical protein KFE98_09045 [bacterium SCSIO 12741]|nr:hypothetical protein KFE98_09045 [bacterium SCSIO 12741]